MLSPSGALDYSWISFYFEIETFPSCIYFDRQLRGSVATLGFVSDRRHEEGPWEKRRGKCEEQRGLVGQPASKQASERAGGQRQLLRENGRGNAAVESKGAAA